MTPLPWTAEEAPGILTAAEAAPPCAAHPQGLPGHYWKFEASPGSLTTRAVCAHCGLKKDFYKHIEDARRQAQLEGRGGALYGLTGKRRGRPPLSRETEAETDPDAAPAEAELTAEALAADPDFKEEYGLSEPEPEPE